ncbi:hypothetical protein ACQCSV_13565 [Pseudarthrobacter sp. S3]|uniref:hypothetical protein n=1 Tax=Pseudarthrobacter sp. S3 TaxID=3418419 RepID=UPI003CEE06C3
MRQPKLNIKRAITLTAATTAILLGVSACSSGSSSNSNSGSNALPSTVNVLYEVVGTATGADITIETGDGTSQQSISVPLKSKSTGANGLSFTMKRGAFVYISAQNKGNMRKGASVSDADFYGSLTCRISVDGTIISQNSTTSKYGIASCKGSAS